MNEELILWVYAVANFVVPLVLSNEGFGLVLLIERLKGALNLSGWQVIALSLFFSGLAGGLQTLFIDRVWELGTELTPLAFSALATAWWAASQLWYGRLKRNQ